MTRFPDKIICKRTPKGDAEVNLPQIVVSHSPDGFEFGYSGSGPADLALNILETYLQSVGYRGKKTRCVSGKCFTLAWALHQDFKMAFISSMQREGGTITRAEIQAWLLVNGRNADMSASPEADDVE